MRDTLLHIITSPKLESLLLMGIFSYNADVVVSRSSSVANGTCFLPPPRFERIWQTMLLKELDALFLYSWEKKSRQAPVRDSSCAHLCLSLHGGHFPVHRQINLKAEHQARQLLPLQSKSCANDTHFKIPTKAHKLLVGICPNCFYSGPLSPLGER